MAFKQDNKKNGFTKISIGLASPDEIMQLSGGEVLKPETINYRTYKPERDGLFCERIFGPTKDYECHCGKYKRIRYKGIVCERCGVEVTEKKVRRERMGHIKLVVPVAHIWYLRSLPSKMASLLGIPTKLDSIIYYEKYIVVKAGALAGQEIGEKNKDDKNRLPIEDRMLLDEEQYAQITDILPENNDMLDDSDPDKFIAKMGADAIYDLLCNIDLDTLSYQLRDQASTSTSVQRKQEALKRLQVVESFRASKGKTVRNGWYCRLFRLLLLSCVRWFRWMVDVSLRLTSMICIVVLSFVITDSNVLLRLKRRMSFSVMRNVCSKRLLTRSLTTRVRPRLSNQKPTAL